MKRVVGSSLWVLFILLAIAGGLFYVQRYYGITGGKPVKAIPADAAFFIEADISSGIISDFSKAIYWNDLQQLKSFKKTNSRLLTFDSIARYDGNLKKLFANEKLILSAHVTKANEFDFLFLISLSVPDQYDFADNAIKKLSGESAESVTHSYEDVDIKEITLPDGDIFTYAVSKNVFIGSFTAFLVEDAIRQQQVAGTPFGNDKNFNALYEKSVKKKSNKVYINYKNLPGWFSIFKNENQTGAFRLIDKFASWSVLDIEINNRSVYSEGTTYAGDSALYAFPFFSQSPVDLRVLKILPRKTAVVIAAGFLDKKKFFSSFQKYLENAEDAAVHASLLKEIKSKYKFSPAEKFYGITGNEFALLITEPAGINYDNSTYFILETNEASNAKKILQTLSILTDRKQNEKTIQEKYNSFSIGLLRIQGLIPALYGNTFRRVNKMYYTFIKNYIVFANQASSLRSLIDDYREENLLINDEAFHSVMLKLPLRANYFFYSRIPASRYIIKSALAADWFSRLDSSKNYLNKWNAFALSISSNNGNLLTSSLLQYGTKSYSSEASLLWSAQLDTSVSMKPQVVKNIAGNKNIIIQDDADNLYLLDNAGTIIWKKQLSEKIKGEVYTIDLYKNNSYQYIFNTENYLFAIDYNGNYISNYPLHLPAQATNALSVFDFDSTRDYRIYIACNNGKVYGYDGNGKPLAGWNFDFTTGLILQPVQLFSVNEKKYLITSDQSGKIFILDRTGQTEIKTNGKAVRKRNIKFYSEENPKDNFGFTTLDSSGIITRILLNGEVEKQSIDAFSSAENFTLCDVDGDNISDYIFTDKDQVSAYTNQMTLIFNYSMNGANADGMECYHLSEGKNAIGVHSVLSNKLYLLKNNGMPYHGFPLKGSSPFVIDELNNDGKQYLIAGSADGNVYVYSIE